ncbi:MAG TPA: glycosyltransferase family 4 protein [Burkholderiales bacterium]|nr:glycosyltransferase family 4 protein [Burkholderiales bacterium]
MNLDQPLRAIASAVAEPGKPWLPQGGTRLRILLSAYACEPHLGSEPGVGWHWATRLARAGHEVRVLTRANNRESIERALATEPVPNLNFAYYDLPQWMRRWKNHAGLAARLYYLAWQWGAYKVARRLCSEFRFDVAHHITFGVFRHPSFMAFLGLPFVFGPVGGGETAPRELRRTFPLRGVVIDLVRDLANWVVRVDPLMAAMFRRSAATLCKTSETLQSIPPQFHDKCLVQVELGTDEHAARAVEDARRPGSFRVLHVGRLVYWKGLHLGLMAFAEFRRSHPDARMTVIGRGPDGEWLRALAVKLGVHDVVDWVPHLERAAVMRSYSEHDAFLFPSLHDSSGNVVLEALSRGLPVVCLDAGGPAVLVGASCGFKVRPGDARQVTGDLARALDALARNPALRRTMGRAAALHAREEFSWSRQVSRMERLYQSVRADSRAGAGGDTR